MNKNIDGSEVIAMHENHNNSNDLPEEVAASSLENSSVAAGQKCATKAKISSIKLDMNGTDDGKLPRIYPGMIFSAIMAIIMGVLCFN